MQDIVPAHSAQSMKNNLSLRGINWMVWPFYRPDFNPKYYIWDKMKSYINEIHPEPSGKPSKNKIPHAVLEAWESIEAVLLDRLIKSMPARCLNVIRIGGMATLH